MKIDVRRQSLPLSKPYSLSFGDVHSFESLLIRVVTEKGCGYGEVTPLPGYSNETTEIAERAILLVLSELGQGRTVEDATALVADAAPMAVSALHCAIELASGRYGDVFNYEPKQPIPIAALCAGKTQQSAAASADAVLAAGHRVLKLKVGAASVDDDIARMKAVGAVVAGRGMMRIDANQALSKDGFQRLLKGIEGLPIELVEQPFAPERDDLFGEFALRSTVPLMLDESIWTAADLRRAAELGAKYVKLKLCKHPGLQATLDLVRLARTLGMRVVFGNGVQGAIGNRTEMFIFDQAGIDTAIEANGFAKVRSAEPTSGMALLGGYVAITDPTPADSWFTSAEPLCSLEQGSSERSPN